MNLNSLSENLKDVPQEKLIGYAQDPNSVVPQFLALAEIQRRKTLERGAGVGAPPTTVAQDIMAQANPQAPQGLPAMQRPQGVAALPTGMDEQSFAGGGIVAFNGDKRSDVEDPYASLSFEEKLKRLRAAEDEDTDASQNRMFRRNRELPGMFSMGNFNKNLQRLQPEDESGRGMVTPAQATYSANVPKTASPDQYLPGVQPDALGRYIAGPQNAPSPVSKSRTTTAAKSTSAESTPTTPKEDMYSRYEEMLKGQAAENKAGREQDKWMRLLEAGLGIMGGTSPYAAANIGQGAMGAVKGYAQDLAAQRKEERENVKDLMGLGLKKEEAQMEARKLAMQEKYYGAVGAKDLAMADYYSGKGAGAGAAGSAKMDIAKLNAIKGTFATLQKDASNLGSPNYGKSPEELWNLATQMVNPGASGGNIAPATSMPTYNPQTRTFK